MRYQTMIRAAVLGGSLVLALTGCKDAFKRLDCQTICQSLKDCQDDGIKLGRCTDDCFDAIDGHESLEKDARHCATCIDDFHNRTCSEVKSDCHTCDEVTMTFMGGAGGE